MTSSKRCFKCGKVKPVGEFYRHRMMADGYLGKCKECTKSDVSRHRTANVDRIRAYDRERAKNPDRMKAAAEISKRWRQQDSRIAAAHNAVTRAVSKGDLVRPSGCSRCGSSPVYGHHEDYNKKLDVTWLCQPCHKERHKEMAIEGLDPLDRKD